MRVLFMGRGYLGIMTLRRLIEKGFEIPVIITCNHSSEVGSSPEEFKQLAKKHNIDYFHTNNINKPEWISRLKAYQADIGVALLWLYVISEDVIKTTQHGLLNFHGGDLPRYRGNACGNWAILSGETQMGLAVHLMEPGVLDSGPIVVKEYIDINPETTIAELTEQATLRGIDLTVKAVELFASGKAAPFAQSESEALYCYPRLPRDGQINWNKPAQDIYDLIRAVGKPYPGAYTYYRDGIKNAKIRKMIIWSAQVESHVIDFLAQPGHMLKLADGHKWGIACGDKQLLILDEVEIDGQQIDPQKYFKSVRTRLGLDLETEVFRLSDEINTLKKTINEMKNK